MILKTVNIILGVAVGWFLPFFDKVAYIYILHPESQLAQYVKYHLSRKNWRLAWELLRKREAEMDKLTSRGFLFQLAFIVLAIFTVTSVASYFGKALVMAFGARILSEEWQEYFRNISLLKQRLFWQIKREMSEGELKAYLILKTGLLLWLTWLLF